VKNLFIPKCVISWFLKILASIMYFVLFVMGSNNYFMYFKHHCIREASTSIHVFDMYLRFMPHDDDVRAETCRR
jgi:hypothetical protein